MLKAPYSSPSLLPPRRWLHPTSHPPPQHTSLGLPPGLAAMVLTTSGERMVGLRGELGSGELFSWWLSLGVRLRAGTAVSSGDFSRDCTPVGQAQGGRRVRRHQLRRGPAADAPGLIREVSPGPCATEGALPGRDGSFSTHLHLTPQTSMASFELEQIYPTAVA